MLDKLKALWSKWKVQVSVVGGVLIVATTYGTCSYQAPSAESSVEPVEGVTETIEATTTTDTTPEGTTTESTSATVHEEAVTADVNSETTLGSVTTAEAK